MSIIISTLLGVLFSYSTNAMTVSPTIMEIEAKRGDVIKQTLKIKNDSDQAAVYTISAQKFISAGPDGNPQFVTGGEDVDLVGWIQFQNSSITILPNGIADISFSINVPAYAKSGGHYAAIFVNQISSAAPENKSGLTIASRIGILIFMKVSGEIQESAELASFSCPGFSNALPIEFSYNLNNTGNIHLRPQGKIVIKDMFGLERGSVDLNKNNNAVLPGQVRTFKVQWFSVGENSGNAFWEQFENEWENFAIGKYTAILSIPIGSDSPNLINQIDFWVIPWHIAIVFALLIILTVIIAVIIVRLLKRRKNPLEVKRTVKK